MRQAARDVARNPARDVARLAKGAQLLLDIYSADAAYSLRKLRTDYAGSAIRIRRSSDSAEQDIGFSGVGFNTSEAESFCGAGDGFVVTWYDQAGSADLTQAVTVNQPKIINAGSTITRGGFAAIDTDVGDNVELTAARTGSSTTTAFGVMDWNSNVAGGLTQGDSSGEYFDLFQDGSASTAINGSAGSPSYYKNGTLFAGTTRDDLHTFIATGHHVLAVTGLNLSTWTDLQVVYSGLTFHGPPFLQEVIMFDTDESGDRAAIESAINDYYGIF